jgi:hypothetical protein
MWKVENKNGTVFDSIYQRWVGVQVLWEGNSRKVFDILVGLVDHIGQVLLALAERRGRIVVLGRPRNFNLFFKNPHLDVLLEDSGIAGGILGNYFGDSSAPWAIST